jgi:hypothetical protein
MRKNRKFLVIGIIVAVLLAGTIAGVALAQTSTTPAKPKPGDAIMARVASILGIDQTKLEDAFAKAQKEAADSALDARLKQMVDAGRMTQAQADQYKSWWQSRPQTVPGAGADGFMGPMGRFGGRMPRMGMPWRQPGAQQPAVTQ